MSMIKVYSRSPIAHKFTLIQNGVEQVYVIKGTNSHQILRGGVDVPYITEMDEAIFLAIKEEYKAHVSLFGGVHPKPESQRTVEPLIYVAKNDAEATRKMKDSKPVLGVNELVSQTKGVKEFSNKD